ncbi:SRPBCC family protein [Streptomyces sp. NPDC026206]|uniref:SRPBCC family protein n=1 Tax=Streptomyces sp. NPDC026206 TaxID=3157089 RepID=UPI0033E9149F
MTPFLVRHRSGLPVGEAWQRLTDWERHAAHVPLTRIVVTTPPPTRVGTRFVARTGLGPLAVDDVMEVVRWQPPSGGAPGRCRLEKRGSVITGWAELEVGAHGAGSWVVWREALRVRGLPPVFGAVTDRGGRRLFGRVVRRLLDE